MIRADRYSTLLLGIRVRSANCGRSDSIQKSTILPYRHEKICFGRWSDMIRTYLRIVLQPFWAGLSTAAAPRRISLGRMELSFFLLSNFSRWIATQVVCYDFRKSNLPPYMQKAGDSWDISPQFFLDFPQNFRLRTRNQYCTQAIAWGSTI